jgi:hypothetical protein
VSRGRGGIEDIKKRTQWPGPVIVNQRLALTLRVNETLPVNRVSMDEPVESPGWIQGHSGDSKKISSCIKNPAVLSRQKNSPTGARQCPGKTERPVNQCIDQHERQAKNDASANLKGQRRKLEENESESSGQNSNQEAAQIQAWAESFSLGPRLNS